MKRAYLETVSADMASLISECVLNNVQFKMKLGNTVTVQNFFDGTVSYGTIDSLFTYLEKIESEKTTPSRRRRVKRRSTKSDSILSLQLDTLAAVLDYFEEKARVEKAKADAKEDARKELERLEMVDEEKTIEDMKNMKGKARTKRIAELKSILSS